MKKVANILITAYMLLLFVVYPFYMKDGYVEIGNAKFSFWLRISLSAVLLLLPFFITELVRKWKKKQLHFESVDKWLLTFAVLQIATLIFSVDHKEAFLGTEGWNMGFVLYAILCLLYLMLRLLWQPDKVVLCLALLPAGVVFLLGILDRFSIHLISLDIRNPGFLSTLGNINWFTGYLVIFTSVSAGWYLLAGKPEAESCSMKIEMGIQMLCAVITFLGFMAGFAQGSSSVFLFFGALFAVLLGIAAGSRQKMTRLMILWGMWCLSAQLVRLMRVLIPDGYLYDTDNLCGYFTGGGMTIALLVIGELFLAVIWLLLGDHKKVSKWIRVGLLILSEHLAIGVAVTLFYAFICVSNGMDLTELPGWLFWANDSWGNGRGMIYRATLLILTEMTPLQWLVGVGQDCFSVYAYSVSEVAQELVEYFGDDRLTNAHNELLTMLVNQGLAAVVSYLGIFVAYIHQTMRQPRNPASVSITVAAVCYLVHNMVSFANVLNLPFLIILLAIGVNWCRMLINEYASDVSQTESAKHGHVSLCRE